MVKIIKSPQFLLHLKDVYDKPLGHKIRYLWKKFQIHNPMLAYFAIPCSVFSLCFASVVTYMKFQDRGPPKYYEYFIVMRPDDPRVSRIRKGESLSMGFSENRWDLQVCR